ncbi:hypothetical protein J5N97_019184 [Dioscorea zingiberensis]|uniref:Bifunctional inhibitor/plant lipid transfer protein/seed storage helical domain-containing protein n=1 Tax=Dioscorea zingiberensis TaxID=325984 RepID=A0A9D5CEA3_9LILI|nr:hypothetical protein J5N97_019184 [Dioscorea zingiberensis]
MAWLFTVMVVVVIGDDPALTNKCSNDLTKMTNCLDFATAKKDAPTGECCSSVKDIRSKEPVCLCYIIQLTHSGSAAITNLGLQYSRLMLLPDACKLVNTSVTDCPKLLKLPPNSPDAAIFTNNATSAASGSSSGSATVSPSSAGVIDHIMFAATLSIIVASSAILISIF